MFVPPAAGAVPGQLCCCFCAMEGDGEGDEEGDGAFLLLEGEGGIVCVCLGCSLPLMLQLRRECRPAWGGSGPAGGSHSLAGVPVAFLQLLHVHVVVLPLSHL